MQRLAPDYPTPNILNYFLEIHEPAISNFILEGFTRGILDLAHDPSQTSAEIKLPDVLRVLIVMEGIHEIQFLRRISSIVHAHDERLPDLAEWERSGKVIFLHFAGREISEWTDCLARLRKPEFHLYNRRIDPLSSVHELAARRVNQRPGCRAFVTNKRGLENYLHPEAINEARGIDLKFGDHDPVAELAAETCFESRPRNIGWDDLPIRACLRLTEKAKRWLYTGAVERMTARRLAETDRAGEIASWLRTILLLAEGGS